MARRKLHDAEDARRCLDEVAASGMSRVEWAKANGVDGRSLNARHLNLRREEEVRAAPRLVELVPTTRPVSASGGYVVRFGDFAVEVDGGFDYDVLRRLLCVVASC